MTDLTEREQNLIGYLKVMINFMTIWGIYEDRVKKLRDWAFESMKSAGANTDWQNEMLHTLEEEFGLKYRMFDPNTLEGKKENEGSDSV